MSRARPPCWYHAGKGLWSGAGAWSEQGSGRQGHGEAGGALWDSPLWCDPPLRPRKGLSRCQGRVPRVPKVWGGIRTRRGL